MKKLNKIVRNENGSITMFVILSVLFLIFVLVGIYANYTNKLKAQENRIEKIQGNYGEYASIEGMDKLYIKKTQPEVDIEQDTEQGNTGKLPVEYQQVEYIQSTGTQYIDTGVLPNNNTDVKARINISEIDDTIQIAFGSRTSYQVNDYSFWAGYKGEGMVFGYGANVETKEAYPYQGENVLVYTDKNTFTLKSENGTYTKTITENTINGDNSVFIFAGNMNYESIYCMKNMKLYYFKFYENNTLIRDFIPCYRKSDNVIGLYDLVNNVFYTNKGTGNFKKGDDIQTNTLPMTAGTTPWLPDGFSKIEGTSLETGLTIANTDDGTAGTQNYVWIEVPNNIKQTITVNGTQKNISLIQATTTDEIELIVKAYAGDYTEGSTTTQANDWKDEWYSGCGMTYAEYQKAYGSMLKSIQKYGGFWLAQYEAGMSYDKGNRTRNSEITVTKANYAKDQYAYNWVTCSQAQGIANADSVSGEYTSSLPFGIQWDLVCRFLEEKGTKTYDEIATNSAWGNYDDILWTSSMDSRYSADGVTFNASAYTKTAVENILLTTGAIATINSYVNTSGEATTLSATANPMNIHDLAGNASEWTLENSALSDTPSVRRGGNFYNSYKEYQFAHKLAKETTDVEVYTGFRSTLYTEEDIIVHDIYDTFERVDGSDLGIADTGEEWQKANAYTAIRDGKFVGTSTYNIAFVNTGSSNCKIGATFTHDTTESLCGRISGAGTSNYISLQVKAESIEIIEKVNGTNTTLATYTKTIPCGEIYNIELEYNGDLAKAYYNGELILEATMNNATETQTAGIYLYGTNCTADNFYVDILDN